MPVSVATDSHCIHVRQSSFEVWNEIALGGSLGHISNTGEMLAGRVLVGAHWWTFSNLSFGVAAGYGHETHTLQTPPTWQRRGLGSYAADGKQPVSWARNDVIIVPLTIEAHLPMGLGRDLQPDVGWRSVMWRAAFYPFLGSMGPIDDRGVPARLKSLRATSGMDWELASSLQLGVTVAATPHHSIWAGADLTWFGWNDEIGAKSTAAGSLRYSSAWLCSGAAGTSWGP